MKGKEKFSVSATPQFLSGWKEIATYLGRGVRTVQRYERDFGLPVRRPAGKPWGSVVATKPELDAWVMASPIREAFRLTRLSQGSGDTAAVAIEDNLRKMGELREQMAALRAEVQLSCQLLKESVYGLKGNLNQNRWREPARSATALESRDRAAQMFDVLHLESRRKAS
jgi:hypothetical protein